MSVSRPEIGWQAALAIRYAEASHERRDSELKVVEIGALRVAMTVLSSAPRKTPTHTEARVIVRRLVEISSGMTVSSVEGGPSAPPLAGLG
jgi:hypothetical protein